MSEEVQHTSEDAGGSGFLALVKAAGIIFLLAAVLDPQLLEQVFGIHFVSNADTTGITPPTHLPNIPPPSPTHVDTSGVGSVWLQQGVSGAHVGQAGEQFYGQGGIPKYGTVPAEYLQDAWGPYYNQRDVRWGEELLDGQRGFPSWTEGCYASAYAMVAAHFGIHVGGHVITPKDVIENPSYFVKGSPDMWAKLGIPGTRLTTVHTSSITEIAQLTKRGDGVIVAMHHNWTPQEPWTTDHFVVATGVVVHKDGEVDLIIRDPDSPFGKDIDLGSRYQQADGWHITGVKDYVKV